MLPSRRPIASGLKMDIEPVWNFLIDLKIPFETRILIFAGLLGWLVLANLFHFIVKRRETWLGVTAYLQRLREARLDLPNIKFLKWLDGAGRRLVVAEFMFIRHGHLFPYNILATAALIVLTAATLVSRPYIIASTPQSGSYMLNADQTIELEFSLPIDIRELSLNVSPDVGGYWDFGRILGIPLRWKAKFYPVQSFFPEQKIVIYVVNLKSVWNPAVIHEQAVEFFAPKLPNIIAVTPTAGATSVPINTSVEIDYDSVIGDFVQLEYKVTPKENLKIVHNGGTHQVLAFDRELEQGKQYTLTVERTPVSYETATSKIIEIGETEEIEKVDFKTVEAPLIASFHPEGNAVNPSEVIKILFEQPMDTASVEDRFAVSPQIEGTITWENENKTLVVTPQSPLPKETEYQITFKAGMKTVNGGVTKEDLEFGFGTAGKVAVSSFYPENGTSRIDPEHTNIAVQFDQEVDHASAQRKFSLTPYVSGSFLWDENKMIYAVAGKLAYLTTYTVKVSPGVKTVYGLDSNQTFTASFTTRSQTVELNIPQYYQEPMHCQLYAARMVLAYRGVYVTTEQIKSFIGVGENPNVNWLPYYGTHPGPIKKYLASKGISSEIKTNWNIYDLAREIERGNPVIVWWYNGYSQPRGPFTLPGGYTGYKGNHSEVIRGFVGSSSNPTQFLANDPWRGQRVYSREFFLANWTHLKNHTALVIYR